MTSFSKALLRHSLWANDVENSLLLSNIALEHARARSLFLASGVTLTDIRDLTDRFWDMHFDPIAAKDMTAFIIATIHMNLCIGTLSHVEPKKPAVHDVLTRLMRFEVCGEFMLTEVGHGLDARNLETTATLQSDGSFRLQSPSTASAKAMPPTTPLYFMPRVAVVFARLIVSEADHGVKAFLVQLSDGLRMYPGITSRPLPNRPGTRALDHSITTFDNVHLTQDSLLSDFGRAVDQRRDFMHQIHRVSIGTLSLSIMGVSALRAGTYIVAKYSQRRVVGAGPLRAPIIDYSTQFRPIVKAWTYTVILEAYARWTIKAFMSSCEGSPEQHALATIFKVVAMRTPQILDELSERCGWQGLFDYNQIKELSLTIRGNVIAEGDCLVLSIRLVSELLGKRYDIPETKHPNSPLAKRELALRDRATGKVAAIGGYSAHRGNPFNQGILPLCRPLVEAIGSRMAFEAAKDVGTDPLVLAVFEKFCMEPHLDWYVAKGLAGDHDFESSLSQGCNSILPLMLTSLTESGIRDYVHAPIVSDGAWEKFLSGLPHYQSTTEIPRSRHPKL